MSLNLKISPVKKQAMLQPDSNIIIQRTSEYQTLSNCQMVWFSDTTYLKFELKKSGYQMTGPFEKRSSFQMAMLV
jgi:hypothetical protein